MKKFIFSLFLLLTTSTFACWFQMYNYEDYLSNVNNFQHTTIKLENDSVKYTVQNNMVVDLPLSISVKLTSDALGFNNQTMYKPEILHCLLQYRILPNGEWITVSEQKFNCGVISFNNLANYYLGRNNIYPQNLKAGTVIMIRLYISDGVWQSGALTSKVDKKLGYYSSNARSKLYTLEDSYEYYLNDGAAIMDHDCGGGWLPHFVTTVIFSGKYRPIR